MCRLHMDYLPWQIYEGSDRRSLHLHKYYPMTADHCTNKTCSNSRTQPLHDLRDLKPNTTGRRTHTLCVYKLFFIFCNALKMVWGGIRASPSMAGSIAEGQRWMEHLQFNKCVRQSLKCLKQWSSKNDWNVAIFLLLQCRISFNSSGNLKKCQRKGTKGVII